jgi:hypothetical protein
VATTVTPRGFTVTKLLNATAFLFLTATFAQAALNYSPAIRSEAFYREGSDYDRYVRKKRNKEGRATWRQ